MAVTVVKLGGSLALSDALKPWLAALAECAGHVVVAPGGGPFAEAVREAQPNMGFDDRAAHHLALLAMEQYGRTLVSFHEGFMLAGSAAAIRRSLRDGRVPVWAPARMALCARDVPASWDMTSDSLAAWLAGKLGAARLVLVKHADVASPVQAHELVARGIVDALFPRFLAAAGIEAFVAGARDHAAVGSAIRAGDVAGVPIGLP
jgi:dihydroneopterin aldolase